MATRSMTKYSVRSETDEKINLIDMNLKEIRLQFRTGNISMCLEMKFYCNTVDLIETQIADIPPMYSTPIP